jgi:hypothetical protein
MRKETKYLSAAIQMMKPKTKGRDTRVLHGWLRTLMNLHLIRKH